MRFVPQLCQKRRWQWRKSSRGRQTVVVPRKMLISPLSLIAVVALLLVQGASAEPAHALSFRVVKNTPCYKSGPQQGRPPDATIAKGAIVTLIPGNAIGSYQRIRAAKGLECWIDGAALLPVIK
jgi:hypothetical protein